MLTALPTASIIRAALWGFGQLFPFSEFFDNPGQKLIQSAKYLLSWCRKGRYQCPPRKEPQDTRFATSPTCHRIAGCERSVRAVRFPETQVSMVSIALRDQLIHNILVWRAVQRESLTRQGSKAEGQRKRGRAKEEQRKRGGVSRAHWHLKQHATERIDVCRADFDKAKRISFYTTIEKF